MFSIRFWSCSSLCSTVGEANSSIFGHGRGVQRCQDLFPALHLGLRPGPVEDRVLLAYDFTFVCPTEIAGFGKVAGDLQGPPTRWSMAFLVDPEFVHLAWRQNHADLKNLPFAMLADTNCRLSTALGILDEEAGVAKRATFIVDPDGIIRSAYVTDMSAGRNPQGMLLAGA